MALKVVPSGDERCDVHNQRTPQRYVCESCLKEVSVRPATTPSTRRRARRSARSFRRRAAPLDQRALIGAGVGTAIVAAVAILAISGSGGGDSGAASGGGPAGPAPRTE